MWDDSERENILQKKYSPRGNTLEKINTQGEEILQRGNILEEQYILKEGQSEGENLSNIDTKRKIR